MEREGKKAWSGEEMKEDKKAGKWRGNEKR